MMKYLVVIIVYVMSCVYVCTCMYVQELVTITIILLFSICCILLHFL